MILQKLAHGLSLVFMIALAWACKKDVNEKIINPQNSIEDFSSAIQLKVGNYWIYDGVNVDSLGNMKRWGGRDSVWIDRDSLVGNRTYYRRMGAHYRYEWLYDSSNCIVSLPDGTGIPRRVLFSGTNYSDTLYTINQYYSMMHNAGKVINTYLGKLPTTTVVSVNKNVSHKQDPTYTILSSQSFYAKNIGMVFFIGNVYGSPYYRALIDYKIN